MLGSLASATGSLASSATSSLASATGSLASATASAVEAAYSNISGQAAADEEDAESRLALAVVRAQNLGSNLAERVASARTNLDEALSPASRSNFRFDFEAPAQKAYRGVQQIGQKASSLFQQLRLTLLPEEQESQQGICAPQEATAAAVALSCQLWDLWHNKHAALTSAEGLYMELLADSRRTAALVAELGAVEALLRSDGVPSSERRKGCGNAAGYGIDSTTSSSPVSNSLPVAAAACEEDSSEVEPAVLCSPSAASPARQAALQSCSAAIETQAAEAISSFRERAKHYPCGSPSPVTGLLRISRSGQESSFMLKAFEERVAQERRELLTQVLELALAPDLRILTESLSRRVAFWEAEIEENWAQWSKQSSEFHEACVGAAECWEELRDKAYSLLAWVQELAATAPQAEPTPPISYLVPMLDSQAARIYRRWNELHTALVEVAAVLALLGGWADFHHLRGDGHVLLEAKDLLHSIMICLDTYFLPLGFEGRESVRENLASNRYWCLIAACAEADAQPWWAPIGWPRCAEPPQAVKPATAAADGESGASGEAEHGPEGKHGQASTGAAAGGTVQVV